MPKADAKAVKAAALPADHAAKKKKTKKGKKEASCETPSQVGTPKKLTPSTDETDASRLGAASTENTRDSYSETDLSRAESELVVQPGSGQDQEEEYRQHQFRLHQQQQQLQLQQQQQQQLQLQQQQLERLVQHQRQEEIYRQQMQQEDLYRQHLRQQEMLQAAQHAQQLQQQHQHAHHQNQQYPEPGQNWNQLDRKCFSLMYTSFPMHVSPR